LYSTNNQQPIKKIEIMKSYISFLAILIATSSCSFMGDNGSLDGPGPIIGDGTSTAGSTLLSGTQSTSITLTNNNPDPTLPDYCIEGNYNISASVIIEPGVIICMKENARITVNSSGSLNATGTAASPITIRGISPIAGYWGSLVFSGSNSTSNNLVHVNISDGGSNSSWDAIVYGYSSGRVYMDNCNITRSSSNGVFIYSSSFNLVGLSNTTISSCQQAPLLIQANHIGSLSESITGAGNGTNNIIVDNATVTNDATWKKTGIPYFFTGTTTLSADIIINPGAQFIMKSTARITVNSSGSLNAIGTPSSMIRFTGENNIAGSWQGIVFSGSNNPSNIMRYCEVSYGGNNSSWNALIYLYSSSQFTLGNSSIHDSQTWGLMNYNSSNTFTDEGTNTFYNNASGNIGT
tara:strand:+ start:1251 stop:2471 length:1221 start_codon:yes stop_codon:yes gene_type:complete